MTTPTRKSKISELTLLEVANKRHVVRQYFKKPLPDDIIKKLKIEPDRTIRSTNYLLN